MDEHRHCHRYAVVVQRFCSLGVITFKEMRSTELTGRVLNISREGICIETGSAVEPGFVLFHDRLCGHRAGILVWARPDGDRYCSGIRFLPLSAQDQQKLLGNRRITSVLHPSRRPEEIIETLLQSLSKSK